MFKLGQGVGIGSSARCKTDPNVLQVRESLEEIMTSRTHTDLEQLYESRCGPNADYRRAVWGVLVSDFFSRFIAPDAAVLDLGCGYGDFINAVQARTRLAMDLNPAAKDKLAADVRFFLQDGSEPWNGIRGELP